MKDRVKAINTFHNTNEKCRKLFRKKGTGWSLVIGMGWLIACVLELGRLKRERTCRPNIEYRINFFII